MTITKKFHIGDILSITTERLVSLRHVDGVYDILNFMTGDNLFTHQLPRAGEFCKPYLLKQLPQLKDIDASIVNPKNWRSWLDGQIQRFGEELEVEALPDGVWEHRNPITEAEEMVGKDKVIVVIKE